MWIKIACRRRPSTLTVIEHEVYHRYEVGIMGDTVRPSYSTHAQLASALNDKSLGVAAGRGHQDGVSCEVNRFGTYLRDVENRDRYCITYYLLRRALATCPRATLYVRQACELKRRTSQGLPFEFFIVQLICVRSALLCHHYLLSIIFNRKY
jgi:hypothetical protein